MPQMMKLNGGMSKLTDKEKLELLNLRKRLLAQREEIGKLLETVRELRRELAETKGEKEPC